MKTNLITIVLLFLIQSISAQHTITVRPQHQKEHIYTLREGEYITRNESHLLLSIIGCDYEILTRLNEDYYLINRSGRTKTDRSLHIPYVYKNWRITVNGDNFMVQSRNSDKKYGPIKNVYPYYDYDKPSNRTFTTHTTTSDLFAFQYSEPIVATINGVETTKYNYYVVRPGESPRGPYNSIRIYEATRESLVYTFETEEGKFLSKNSVIKGPYQETAYTPAHDFGNSGTKSLSYFFYKTNLTWKYDHPSFSNYSFSDRPQLTFSSNSYLLTAQVIEKGNVTYQLKPNGELIEHSATSFQDINQNGDALSFKAMDTLNGESQSLRYLVRFKGKDLGVFGLRKDISWMKHGKECDFFTSALIPIDSATGALSQFQVCFFSPSIGLTSPISIKAQDRIYFFDNNYGQLSVSDSSFTLNGNLKYENVLRANFNDYPQNWWLTYLENGFKRRYKNGKPYHGMEAPDQIVMKQSKDQPFDVIEVNNEYFIKPANTTKLLGPVDQYSSYAVANDMTTYAECQSGSHAILIQNKAISEGFNLIYNPKLDAFHWLRITEDKKIYLHTYELN